MRRTTKPITASMIQSSRAAPNRTPKPARGPLGPSPEEAPGGGGAGNSLMTVLSLEDREPMELEQPQSREDDRRQHGGNAQARRPPYEHEHRGGERREAARVRGEGAPEVKPHPVLDAGRHPAEGAR